MNEDGPLIGVLGGLGPLATADFMKRLVEMTPAERDQDHLRVLALSDPRVPDRSNAIVGGGISPVPRLLRGIDILQRNGVDAIAIPCNTSHFWWDELSAHASVPILSILQAVQDEVERRVASGPIGLMATSGAIKAKIYQRHLTAAGFATVEPDELAQDTLVGRAIIEVKAGRIQLAAELAREGVRHLEGKGARAIVLACTELPMVITGDTTELGTPIVNSTAALAGACIAWVARRLSDERMAGHGRMR